MVRSLPLALLLLLAAACSDSRSRGTVTPSAPCSPVGGSRCTNGAISTCGSNGAWSAPTACPSGQCVDAASCDGCTPDCSNLQCGVDPVCGSACGAGCSGDTVCDQGQCIAVVASCRNQVLDPDESDVDCGGACPGCAAGGACNAPADCASGICEQLSCAMARCGDGVVNQPNETCDTAAETATCDADCTAVSCGDGVVNRAAGEECEGTDLCAMCRRTTATHFAPTATQWRTPDGGYDGGRGYAYFSGGDWDAGEELYAVTDLTGDGKPDLVVTSVAFNQFGAPGARFWRVYVNDGTGFAATPIQWSTPDGGYDGGRGYAYFAGGDWDAGEELYTVADMDGDRRPDLVVTSEAFSQFGAAGSRYWKVYRNNGSGFERQPMQWATPDGGYDGGRGYAYFSGGDWDAGEELYSVTDMNGDAKPDLVITSVAFNQFGAPGARHWRVHLNTGTGFASQPIQWSTPDGGYDGGRGYAYLAGGDWDANEELYTVADLTGDGRPDLVVTSVAFNQFGAPGGRFWRVFENDGTGFARTAIEWSTPDGGYDGGRGYAYFAGGDWDAGEELYSVTDLTGDGRPDLVVTSVAFNQFGAPGGRFWRVFANEGTDFASTALQFTTPDGGYDGARGYAYLAGGDWDATEELYTVADMDGDGLTDLVVTSEAFQQFGAAGARFWKVFLGRP